MSGPGVDNAVSSLLSPMATTFFFHFVILLVSIEMVKGFEETNCSVGIKKESALLLPILSSCLTPLSLSATTTWAKDLNAKRKFKNVSAFCSEGGFICNESINVPETLLYAFSTYSSARTKADLQYGNMFFEESFLSLGSLIKLPKLEPQIPIRTFLPPLLEPHLFNHSASHFSNVLEIFDFNIDTPLAKSMQRTLQICNTPPTQGEQKACVATFEDMLDFSISTIGTNNITLLASASLPHDEIVTVVDFHDVTWAGKLVAIACHNAMYPFQVFYCHHIQGSKVFKVTLQTRVDEIKNISALASCHPFHTSSQSCLFSQRHFQKKELLCHWMYGNNIVWIPTTNFSSFS